MKYKLFLPILIIFIFLYSLSYVLLRQIYTKFEERDGCPPDGCEYVLFPDNKLFLIYSPLILVDKTINKAEINIENW